MFNGGNIVLHLIILIIARGLISLGYSGYARGLYESFRSTYLGIYCNVIKFSSLSKVSLSIMRTQRDVYIIMATHHFFFVLSQEGSDKTVL